MNPAPKHFIRQTAIAMALGILAMTSVSAQTAPAGAKPAKQAVKKKAKACNGKKPR